MNLHTRLVRSARAAAMAGGFGMLLVSVMVTLDVLLRKLFNVTLGGATEISGYVFAVATALSYPFVLLDRSNIRIDVIYTLLSGRAKAFLDLVALLLTLLFVGWLTSSVFQLLGKSFGANSMTVGTVIFPLWIPQFVWAFGYALFTLTALYLSVRALGALLRRDWGAVNRIAGVPSVAEVVEEETHLDAETIADQSRRGEAR